MQTFHIQEEFLKNLTHTEAHSRFSFQEYPGTLYHNDYDFQELLPLLYSSKNLLVTSPFSYELQNLNAYCLILTTKGSGKLLYQNHEYELTANTFAFIDCLNPHKLICSHPTWEYTIFFVSRPVTDYYYSKLCDDSCVFKLTSYSNFLPLWEQLRKEDANDYTHALIRAKLLVQLYTELFLLRSLEASDSYHIPTYLSDMKKSFDTAYYEPFSLDELARKYQISKYRLCREFSQYFQETPLQYINQVRIEKAKELLLSTDDKIGVIGQRVGIDNTNHFIRLFKDKTGVTPLYFRKATPIL
ncbi:MAG: helix-turn-helix transcriptional regulator [Lachnospiraceae bacterium]|nr:helix-turn-helix transcriptional regulator [Lachnospiraceae bacterium]